jgi:NADH:quinone reductase (non-electrogenic)
MAGTAHVVIIGGGFGGLDAARALDGQPVSVTLLDRHNYHLFQPLLYQVATAALSPADVASPIRWILRRQANVQVLLAEAREIEPERHRVRYVDDSHGPADQPPLKLRRSADQPPLKLRRSAEASAQAEAPAQAEASAPAEAGGQGPADAGSPGPPEGGQYVPYDYLIVATGSAHAYFGHPEWAPRAPGLKTLDDALDIRRRVLLAFEAAERETDPDLRARLLTFVIVGGGPTGVELAGALAEIANQSLVEDFRSIRPESAHVILLEGSPYVLSTFPGKLRVAAHDALTRLGVDVRTGAMVTGVDDQGVLWRPAPQPRSVQAPRTGGEGRPDSPVAPTERISAETVLWAAGVAASPLARSLGVPLDRVGRVLAEPTLRVPGRPEIFVVGDVCALEQDGRPLPGVAQVAMQGGAHAAKNVLRAIRGEPLVPFRYRDYGNAATIGRGSAVVDMGSIKASGFLAWLFWLFLHIFWLIGFRNRLAVMGEWAWSYFTFQRRARLITGEKMSPENYYR